MVGFALALAGGAAKGWGTGQLEAIKAKREEKLAMLEHDLRSRQLDITQSEGAANRASQERLTGAQLGVQERLGNLQAETSKTNALLSATVQREGYGVQKDITQAQIDANKTLQEMQITAQADLNIKPVTVTENGKQVTRLMKGDQVIKNPIDPNTGKPIDIAIDPENDTPQISNFKYLVGIGADPEDAKRLAFDPGTDPAVLKTQLVTTLLKARVGDFGTADDEDTKWADDQADVLLKGILGAGKTSGGSATEPAGSEAGAVEGTTSGITVTSEIKDAFEKASSADVITKAKDMLAKGKSRAAVRELLRQTRPDIDPKDVGL